MKHDDLKPAAGAAAANPQAAPPMKPLSGAELRCVSGGGVGGIGGTGGRIPLPSEVGGIGGSGHH